MLECPVCKSDELELVERLPDDRRIIRCSSCHHTWTRGEAKRVTDTPASYSGLRDRFPDRDSVEPERMARVEALKAVFLEDHQTPDPEVLAYWARYQKVFSADNIADADPEDLREFANSTVGAAPGNMSVFNRAWKSMGDYEATARTRNTIRYLLYGPPSVPMADRFTRLVHEQGGLGMTGFKESLLTRVLCVVEPERYLPILTYSTPAGGKREIAQAVYGLELPEAARVQWTIGRLMMWSNDLLVDLAGDGFSTLQQVSQFFGETKSRELELA
ncbi:hypothetical protein ACPPVS_00560 [Cellulomonas sp. McL0617]|uniref:hypothetical protein n=1 Tax=Cellulomonas sp. McL0617 TaxID=3415675 RepID=UPI003CF850C5